VVTGDKPAFRQGVSCARARLWRSSNGRAGLRHVDWPLAGDDIIRTVRRAYDGAHNSHDANRITFGKVEGYEG